MKRKNDMSQTLLDFADFLDGHRPSTTQLALSPDYNMAVVRTLEWVAKEARRIANDSKINPGKT